MPELSPGRFFDAYGASMDAALEAKVCDIESFTNQLIVLEKRADGGARP